MNWEDYFNLAKIYFSYHGNLDISYDFKTINGYEPTDTGLSLGKWLFNQKIDYFTLEKEKQELLISIGFTLSANEEKWLMSYRLAKKYYEYHGNLKISDDFKTKNGYEPDETGTNLGTWLNTQKVNYAELSQERKQALINIGLILGIYEENWFINYRLAKKYYEHHGNLRVPKKFKTINGYEPNEAGINLGSWVITQRRNYINLSKEKQELLNSIGFVLNLNEENWFINYRLAQKYFEYHGNLDVSYNFRTKNGYEKDETGTNLSSWLRTQKRNYRTLSKEKQELLSKIGFSLEKQELSWEDMYKLARVYFEHHGSLEISADFKTINGYMYNKNGPNLTAWLTLQKELFTELSTERQELLSKIGFNLEKQELSWEDMFKLALKYYKHHKNLTISSDFKTKNGYTYDKNGESLGAWLENQKRNYKNLSKERQKLLLSIGLVQEFSSSYWDKQYNIAKRFYEHYGYLFVPIGFKTLYGYEFNEDGLNLDIWLNKQIKRYSRLQKEKQDLLIAINIPKNSVEETWQNMYNLAQIYYKHHNNLEIPYSFKTINGYEPNETGINLGTWLNIQILNYFRLTDEQQKLLKLIGFIPNSESVRWKRFYELARIYYAYYGNLNIPDDFKTYDGYKYDEYGFNLGSWLNIQINTFLDLPIEKQELLKIIDINIKEDTLKLKRKP